MITTDISVRTEEKFIEIDLSGELERSDYEALVPSLEQWIKERGKLRLLVVMHDFHGGQAGALWEEIKFGFRHSGEIERMAFVGEAKWQHYLSNMLQTFTAAQIRYFDADQLEAARAWLSAE